LSTLIDDLPFSDSRLNKFPLGHALELIRRIDKNLKIPAAKFLIEVEQYPFEPVKIAFIGLLNQNEIYVALARLPTPCKRPKQNGFSDAVFLEYGPGALDDIVDRVDLTIHGNT
jgi:hypothetical protein